MRTTYYLVITAAVVAVALTAYTRFVGKTPAPPPSAKLVADAPSPVPPMLALPPVPVPPHEPLKLPPIPVMSPAPPPLPPKPDSLVIPASAQEPPIPPITAPPNPGVNTPGSPNPGSPNPGSPNPGSPNPGSPVPVAPVAPPVFQPPVKPEPMKLDPPRRLDSDSPRVAPEPLATTGRYIVLKDDKLIEGPVSVSGDTVIVRQGALDRPFTKSQVQFVGATKDDVYRFMLAKVSATDGSERLKVARWCMFSGLREQALAEAREVRKLQPNNTEAAALIRSLELSLQQFPVEGTAMKMTAPAAPTFPVTLNPGVNTPGSPNAGSPNPGSPNPGSTVPPIPPAIDPEPDVTPEAASVFATRVQPFLANQCVQCHAKPDHEGTFKLARVTPTEAGAEATRTNLRAVAGQLRKDEPTSSPLLVKALTAHGGMRLPAVESRRAAAYQTLEAWVALAVGTPVAPNPGVNTPGSPALVPPTLPVSPTTPTVVAPPSPPVGDPLLLAVPVTPAPKPEPGVNTPGSPVPVPGVNTPGSPTPRDPLLPPRPAITPSPRPVEPTVAPTPKPVLPAPPIGGTNFGVEQPPKLPATGPTSTDEFDPAGFNKSVPPTRK